MILFRLLWGLIKFAFWAVVVVGVLAVLLGLLIFTGPLIPGAIVFAFLMVLGGQAKEEDRQKERLENARLIGEATAKALEERRG